MLVFDGAAFSTILVCIILVGEGQMNSMEREQGNHKVKGIKDKVALHLMRGKRDFLDYKDLNNQVMHWE